MTKETDKRVAQISETIINRCKSGEIIPSFLNRKHSKETKEKISKTMIKKYNGGFCKWYEYTNPAGEIFKLQGTWEVRFARVLDIIDDNWIKPKLNENYSFEWIDENSQKHYYTPDFYSPKLNKYFEVKGYYSKRDKRKMKFVFEQNKNHKIEMVFKKDLKQYEKLLQT